MPRLGSRVRASFSAQDSVRTVVFAKCPGGGMVDALVSGASVERRAGSSPVQGTRCCAVNQRNGEVAELVDALL